MMRRVPLILEAEEDLTKIWLYTYETWGLEQADHYYDQIVACCEAVGEDKLQAKSIDGLPLGVSVQRCQQHYIFYMPDDRPIILAILHERMDIVKRLKGRI